MAFLTALCLSLPQPAKAGILDEIGDTVGGAVKNAVGFEIDQALGGLMRGAFGGNPADFFQDVAADIFGNESAKVANIEGTEPGAIGLPDLQEGYENIETNLETSESFQGNTALVQGMEKGELSRAVGSAISMASLGKEGQDKTAQVLEGAQTTVEGSFNDAASAQSAPSTQTAVKLGNSILAKNSALLGTIVGNQKKSEVMDAAILQSLNNSESSLSSLVKEKRSASTPEAAAVIKRSSAVSLR